MDNPICRFCHNRLEHTFCDLGMTPLSNAYLTRQDLRKMEPFYPLHAYVCDQCFLVQVIDVQSPENIFTNYAYFSSYSKSWLEHVSKFAEMAVNRFKLCENDVVIEVASNDGCLLKNFVDRGLNVLGIEPAANVAEVAESAGVHTLVTFFGVDTASKLAGKEQFASLLVANNVLAHVPDINDFVAGIKIVLDKCGVATLEFPHILKLIAENQFDTIYHEHFSYLSLTTVAAIFKQHGLRIFDVEEIWTHGGSLRVYGCHSDNADFPTENSVTELIREEKEAGLTDIAFYQAFGEMAKATKRDILKFLVQIKQAGERVVAYGAPAKGNTLLNYCGIGTDFIDFAVDRNPHKQGLFLPGTHIPIRAPEAVFLAKPDYLLILPWNFKDEVVKQMSDIRSWGGRFVTPIPAIQVLD